MRSNVIHIQAFRVLLSSFPADSHLWYWLTVKGYEFDIITDDELHKSGADAIKNYSIVITCSHPEYHTPNSLDALQEYTDAGGHLMYLGVNGFYWKVAVGDNWPDAVKSGVGKADSSMGIRSRRVL